MAPTPVLLPGKSHGWGSLVGCSPWGCKESDTTERLHFHFSLFTFMHWRRKWHPTPVFLTGESQGQWSLVGCRLWGCTESDTTEATQQQQQQQMIIHTGKSARHMLKPYYTVCKDQLLSHIYILHVIAACSVMFDSLQSYGLQPARLLCSQDCPERTLEWVTIPFSRGSFRPRD